MADKNGALTRAESHFSASEARDALIKSEMAKERTAFDERTRKLKALRLAREAEEAAAKALAGPAAAKPRKKKAAVAAKA